METRKDRNPKLSSSNDNLIIGIRPLLEALDAGIQIDKVFISKDVKGEHISQLKTKINKLGFYYQDVPQEKLHRLSSGNHQGVIAFTSPVQIYNLGDVLNDLIEKEIKPAIVILDRVSDVRNFGAIVRTAEALGVQIVIIPAKGAAQINEETVKTSAGAIFNIKICKEFNLENTFAFLKTKGFKIVGISEKSNKEMPYYNHTEEPVALVLGSEEDGISSELWFACDEKYKIPLTGNTKSLNVSVAAGIAMYQVFV